MKQFNRKDFLKLVALGLGATQLRSGASHASEKSPPSSKENLIELQGKTLHLKNGPLVLQDKATLRGPGTVILDPSCPSIQIKGKEISVQDVRFIAHKSKEQHSSILHLMEGSEHIRISNCHFTGSRYCILKGDINTAKDSALTYKKPVRELLFMGNTCLGSFSRHLYLHSIHEIKILANHFENCTRDSIRLRQNIKKVQISHNSFNNIGIPSPESSDAIDSYWSGEELIILGNHFSNISTNALDLKGVSPDKEGSSSNVIVSHNIFDQCQFSGVMVSSGGIIEGKENAVHHISVTQNHFSKCNLDNKSPNIAAILVRHGVKNIQISHNQIFNNYGHGIHVGNYEQKVEQTQGVMIHHNTIEVTRSDEFCLYLHAIKNALINNNFFTSPNKKQFIKRITRYKKFKESNIVIGDNLEAILNNDR